MKIIINLLIISCLRVNYIASIIPRNGVSVGILRNIGPNVNPGAIGYIDAIDPSLYDARQKSQRGVHQNPISIWNAFEYGTGPNGEPGHSIDDCCANSDSMPTMSAENSNKNNNFIYLIYNLFILLIVNEGKVSNGDKGDDGKTGATDTYIEITTPSREEESTTVITKWSSTRRRRKNRRKQKNRFTTPSTNSEPNTSEDIKDMSKEIISEGNSNNVETHKNINDLESWNTWVNVDFDVPNYPNIFTETKSNNNSSDVSPLEDIPYNDF